MSQIYEAELQTAIEAVRKASQICRSVQGRIDGEKMDKADRSPVTIADYASQAIICSTIRASFPEELIVAEEDARDLRTGECSPFLDQIVEELKAVEESPTAEQTLDWIDFGNHSGGTSRFWTLDPIDGTKGFLRKEQYAISLALIVDGEIQVAALACPNLRATDAWDNARGVIFTAVRGMGARLCPLDLPDVTPHSVRVSGTRTASAARMCESVESGHSSHDWSSRILSAIGSTSEAVRLDSQAKYGVLARGEADVYLRLPVRKDYSEKIWDHAGGVLVVEEAGGKVTDIDGNPLDFSLGTTLKSNRGVVATNGLLHDGILAAVQSSSEAPTAEA
ncbi:Inositol-1-monophosphatase [Thalassoglobus neptunius]|uniref:3'(2'),5'-bisphosphate nucleotidase n=1 Tax=Thalassoglobus neptunius TaxID=1938619 RepID=A0A5C5WPQ9_9PLAN|nr:3'(2'),5'-bisphosphate nucleotidase [Thalassoglobus neptunius]TWT52245.1 Inositol-1-monophosphatase [Thalassoglobus neptunius]